MSQPTPFQLAGFKPEDELIYVGDSYPNLKNVVKLVLDFDDGSNAPKFKRVDGLKLPCNSDHIFLKIESLRKVEASGLKFDGDKIEYSLLPTGVLQPVLKILGFGKKKYAKDNWQRVDNAKERYYNAAMRHITSWWEGEKTDPETGENHLAHAVCCLFFLIWFDNKGNT